LSERSIVVSLFLAALFGYCIPVVDFKFSNTFLGAMHMPAGAIAVLLALLLVVNPLLKLLSSRLCFARNEILTVYITCLFSTLVPGRGAENFFVPNILSSFYFATSENRWLSFLTPYLKPWMTPALNADGSYHASPVEGWYTGLRGSESIPWGLWMRPLLAWSALILAVQVLHACLAVLLRAQWAEREALAFPLLRLPLEMTEDTDYLRSSGSRVGAFFANPMVWIGFGVSVWIEGLNGLSLYFREVPSFPLSMNTGALFTEVPWDQLGHSQMQIFPAIVGISFLLTSEVSFSLWFFHLFSKAQYVMAYLAGFPPATLDSPLWTRGWAKGFIGYQQVGALLAYVAILGWVGREHWKHVASRALGRVEPSAGEQNEALSYPVAFWGAAAALLFILGWSVAAGIRLDVAILLWSFYLAVSLALTRLVAEAGLLFVQTGWMPLGPLAFLVGAGPGHLINASSAAPAAMVSSSLMLDMRGFLMPSFLQGFKLAHDRKIPARPLLALIAACILISFGVGLVTVIRLGYMVGGLQLANWWATAAGSQPALHAVAFARGIETNYAVNWAWVGGGALASTPGRGGQGTRCCHFKYLDKHPAFVQVSSAASAPQIKHKGRRRADLKRRVELHPLPRNQFARLLSPLALCKYLQREALVARGVHGNDVSPDAANGLDLEAQLRLALRHGQGKGQGLVEEASWRGRRAVFTSEVEHIDFAQVPVADLLALAEQQQPPHVALATPQAHREEILAQGIDLEHEAHPAALPARCLRSQQAPRALAQPARDHFAAPGLKMVSRFRTSLAKRHAVQDRSGLPSRYSGRGGGRRNESNGRPGLRRVGCAHGAACGQQEGAGEGSSHGLVTSIERSGSTAAS